VNLNIWKQTFDFDFLDLTSSGMKLKHSLSNTMTQSMWNWKSLI